jgi:hypothetical protein
LIETLSHDYSLAVTTLQIPKKVNEIFSFFLGGASKVVKLGDQMAQMLGDS